MRQVEYSFALCKNTYVYSPTRGGSTAFSIPLDSYLTDMGKQGWDWCGWMPDRDGITKIILKRYAPAPGGGSRHAPPRRRARKLRRAFLPWQRRNSRAMDERPKIIPECSRGF
jgi:hypothetical protein